MNHRIVVLTLAALAGGAVMGSPAPGKKKPSSKPPTSGFWADSRDDFYHQSSCTTSHKPAGAQLVTGSEQELIALGYYPDPVCLPNRSIATRAGRLVRVQGVAALPTVPPAEPGTGGFPSLAPGGEAKPEAPPKPAEKPPTIPPASEAPKPPPPAIGGFPSPGGAPPTPPTAPAANRPDPAFFRASVLPVLRICTCHGQNGNPANQRFAMTGTERDYDQAVRRVTFKDPARSLLVLKPTGRVRHGGGQRLRNNTPELQALLDWINGAVPKP